MITFIKGLIRMFGVLGAAALAASWPILMIGDGIYGMLLKGDRNRWLEILAGTLFGCMFFGVDPSRMLKRKKKMTRKTERASATSPRVS
jgi:hypothetical protein